MADQWNAGNPALTNQIANDIPDINENTHWLKDIIQMLAGWKTSDILTVGPGCVTRRPKFAWVDGNTITINPGGYFHDGTTRQWVFWDSAITFEAFRPGAGGSNADNAAASASAWHYIYLDNSAIATNASPELVANCFLNSTSAPTWSASAHGWYTGSDRCIFAVLTDGSSNILEFYHDGGELVMHGDYIIEASLITPTNTWTDVDCATSLPGFCSRVHGTALSVYVDTTAQVYVRPNGQTATTGHIAGYVANTSTHDSCTFSVNTDSSRVYEVRFSAATAGNTVTLTTDGWYFPVGM